MAQAVLDDEVELESLLSQAKAKARLIQNDGQQIFRVAGVGGLIQNDGQQFNSQSSGAEVSADKLKYGEPSGWKITTDYAILKGCSRLLCVQGEYSSQNLEKLFYQVSFEVMLGNKCSINKVELKLTLPDGSVETSTETLKTYPKNKLILLKVGGEFFNSFQSGNIKFELKGTESTTLKKGLAISGVQIASINT